MPKKGQLAPFTLAGRGEANFSLRASALFDFSHWPVADSIWA
jgi:hypothetical protein